MKHKITSIAVTTLVVCLLWVVYLRLFPNSPQTVYVSTPPPLFKQFEAEAKKIAEVVNERGMKQATLERVADIVGNGDLSNLPISRATYDSLMLENLNKDKKLQRSENLHAELMANNLRAVQEVDSLKQTIYTYKDSFLTAKFRTDTAGGMFDFRYKINLVQHDYRKRKNFFSPYRNYTDIISPDPRIVINGLRSITIAPPKKHRFGLGLSAGYSFTAPGQITPYLGIGVNYNLIEF